MITDAIPPLRHAFRARARPEIWLRDDLHPMDHEDGVEFVDHLKSGGSPEKYFLSAIPYPAFLTVEADLYLLPEFFATIVTESTQAIAVLSHLQASGHEVVSALTDSERTALVHFIESLMRTEEMAFMTEPLSELKELVQKKRAEPGATDNPDDAH